jgi:hypothetical protein
MKKPPPYVRFVRWFMATLVTGIAIVVTLVAIIDPYNQYQIVVRQGFNLIKPGLTRYQQENKLTQASKLRPDALILGHSRAEVGFDPDGPAFVQRSLSAYNLAIPGTGISTARVQVEYLYKVGIKPKVIILGVEFLDFLEAPQKMSAATEPSHPTGDRHSVTGWFWRFDSLFSLGSVNDAIRTLFIQHNSEMPTITSKGFNPLKEYPPLARTEGYFTLFQQRAQENTETYLRKAKGSLSLADLTHLRVILDLAAEHGADVKLIIYPYHAQILALFEETGIGLSFEEWKTLVTREVSGAQLRHPRASIGLFDFSGFGNYNCERIPAQGDRVTATRWYWEAGHFKKELGDVVLDVVLSAPANSLRMVGAVQDKLNTFGFELNESNSAINRRRIDLERSECMRNYPELFAEAATLVQERATRKKGR